MAPARHVLMVAALTLTVGALVVTGVVSGGRVHLAQVRLGGHRCQSFLGLFPVGITASAPVNAVQLVGILAAVVLVLAVSRGRNWVGALAAGYAVVAFCSANPQPWYLLWALPLVACTVGNRGVQSAMILVLCAMTAWSVLAFGLLVGYIGIITLAVMWIRSSRWWRGLGLLSRPFPAEAGDAALIRPSG